eukprot:scaffold32199_cov108-Isochrysis_galbana.AAC.8
MRETPLAPKTRPAPPAPPEAVPSVPAARQRSYCALLPGWRLTLRASPPPRRHRCSRCQARRAARH